MNIHSSKYKCSECEKTCYSNQALQVHRRSHSGEKPFECSVCGNRFTTAGSLTVHNRIHTGEKPYKCRLCDKAFYQSAKLTAHLRIHSSPRDKPYRCLLCDKSFSTSRCGLGCLAALHLPRVPVGPPARWSTATNVEGGSGIEEGTQGPLAKQEGQYMDELLALAPHFLVTPLLMGPFYLISQFASEHTHPLADT